MVRRGDAHLMDQERATATRIAAGSGWYSSVRIPGGRHRPLERVC